MIPETCVYSEQNLKYKLEPIYLSNYTAEVYRMGETLGGRVRGVYPSSIHTKWAWGRSVQFGSTSVLDMLLVYKDISNFDVKSSEAKISLKIRRLIAVPQLEVYLCADPARKCSLVFAADGIATVSRPVGRKIGDWIDHGRSLTKFKPFGISWPLASRWTAKTALT